MNETVEHSAPRWAELRHRAIGVNCAGTHLPVVAANSSAAPAAPCAATGTAYARTELFFGKSISGDGTVTDASFTQFLDQEVTPRFPAGFTVVPAMGQYRETNGVTDHEASDMLILFYPRDAGVTPTTPAPARPSAQ